jgi:heme a synthase
MSQLIENKGQEPALIATKPPSQSLYRFAIATSIATLLLLVAGALVTNNHAGDSVPDWPLAFGRLIPPLIGGIRFEYFHRVLAGIVSIMTLILALWVARSDARPLARRLGWAALGLVVAQGILGGIRVLEGHPALSATAHAALGQIFFITVAGLSLYLSPWWQSDLLRLEDSGWLRVRSLCLWTTAAILAQIILGAAFRHGATGLTPHLVGAGVVTVLVIWTAIAVKTRFRRVYDLRKPVFLLHAFYGIQIVLGAAAWWVMLTPSGLEQPEGVYVALTVAHVLGGALLLVSSLILTLISFRLIRPAPAAIAGRAASHSETEGSPERAGA